jgi:hypothetical protein
LLLPRRLVDGPASSLSDGHRGGWQGPVEKGDAHRRCARWREDDGHRIAGEAAWLVDGSLVADDRGDHSSVDLAELALGAGLEGGGGDAIDVS